MPAEAKSLESAVWRGSGWEAVAGSEDAGAGVVVRGGKPGEVEAAGAIAGVARRRAAKKRREEVCCIKEQRGRGGFVAGGIGEATRGIGWSGPVGATLPGRRIGEGVSDAEGLVDEGEVAAGAAFAGVAGDGSGNSAAGALDIATGVIVDGEEETQVGLEGFDNHVAGGRGFGVDGEAIEGGSDVGIAEVGEGGGGLGDVFFETEAEREVFVGRGVEGFGIDAGAIEFGEGFEGVGFLAGGGFEGDGGVVGVDQHLDLGLGIRGGEGFHEFAKDIIHEGASKRA